ncbi:protein phosphatase slingshot, partial [Paragonimus westermani]
TVVCRDVTDNYRSLVTCFGWRTFHVGPLITACRIRTAMTQQMQQITLTAHLEAGNLYNLLYSHSQSEDFLMCKATAVGLNVRSRRRSSYIKPNAFTSQVVRLQSEFSRSNRHRYCCVISTNGKQGTEESAILGIDITDRRATVGLVLPIWQDMSVKLYGDGGFELITKDTEKQFKPVSVQALWAAFQAVNRACQVARTNAYYSRGLTHDWVGYYHSLPASDTCQIQEWLKTDDIDSFNCYIPPPSPISEDSTDEERERAKMEALLRVKLQEIMCTLRERLEEELGQSLRDYRHFIEEEVLIIYGRMDAASVIFDHLLLGTTFNASNRAELERRSVTHILNVTREVDNFFPGEKYEYRNIRVFDDERSSLLSYFEETHRFINEAKAQGTTCLVHCKMGISRSATTVIYGRIDIFVSHPHLYTKLRSQSVGFARNSRCFCQLTLWCFWRLCERSLSFRCMYVDGCLNLNTTAL